MKLFISWSGERSMFVAAALRNWLPLVLQAVDPWMSQADLKAGARWNPEIESELAKAVFGVTCVTSENRDAPWLLFEAGALATQVKEKAYLCPYLIDLETSDVDYPLAQFQMKKWDSEGTLGLVRGINDALAEKESKSAIPAANLENLFKALWPQLEKQYACAPRKDSKSAKVEKKDPGELMGETLEQTRDLARQLARVEQKLEGISINTAVPFAFRFGNASPGLGVMSSGVVPFGANPELWSGTMAALSTLTTAKSTKPANPECPKCGATDNFQLAEAQKVNRRTEHHDMTCGTCEAVVRQLHIHDTHGQKRERSCPTVCKFHRKPESRAASPA